MVNKDRTSLQTLRMLSAALKQIEIDQRIDITDAVATREFVRQVKQRQDAATQYRDANRDDLAQKEEAEIVIIQRFLPEAMTDDEIRAAVDAALAESGLPKEMSSMGALMGKLKSALEGRADMSKVSQYLREQLKA